MLPATDMLLPAEIPLPADAGFGVYAGGFSEIQEFGIPNVGIQEFGMHGFWDNETRPDMDMGGGADYETNFRNYRLQDEDFQFAVPAPIPGAIPESEPAAESFPQGLPEFWESRESYEDRQTAWGAPETAVPRAVKPPDYTPQGQAGERHAERGLQEDGLSDLQLRDYRGRLIPPAGDQGKNIMPLPMSRAVDGEARVATATESGRQIILPIIIFVSLAGLAAAATFFIIKKNKSNKFR